MQIQGNKRVSGAITVPGDKSISHRAAILGAVSKGETRIRGFLDAEDTLNTLNAFKNCGVQWRREKNCIIIDGQGRDSIKEPAAQIDLGNSGTGIRLLTGLFSGFDMFTVLTGDASLRSRPMARVGDPLRKMGARIDGRSNGKFAPLSIRGGKLTGIRYEMPVASAQIKSALLLAGLWANGETWVREPGPARDHTEIMLEGFGAKVLRDSGGWVGIRGGEGDNLEGREIYVPGDISSAAFFIVAALITQGKELRIGDVGVNTTRTGILDILGEMGASIEIKNVKVSGGEKRADIAVKCSPLKGIKIGGARVIRAIDEFPILAVAAAYADGETEISDASELRVKESDRIATISAELRKMGADIVEKPDGMIVRGGKPLHGAEVESHSDHRIAMALAVAALGADGKTTVKNTECIATSFPNFEQLLDEVTSS